MLPKVATTLLHSTSRAAAAVQNQTHTFRNVLQLQSSSSPSSGPSKNGPGSSGSNYFSHNGTGSSKHNAGSRFQSGYHGASRAVTQANASAIQDATNSQSDDNNNAVDDHSSTKRVHLYVPRKPRIRSHSVSLSGRPERAEQLGVLRVVQLHTRSRHVFAPHESRPELQQRNTVLSIEHEAPSPPLMTRRNSTSVSMSTDVSPQPPPPPPPPTTASPPPPPLTSEHEPPQPPQKEDEDYLRLQQARNSRSFELAAEAVRFFRQTSQSPSLQAFNMALDALAQTRQHNEPMTLLLETYNDMLKRGFMPNLRTYTVLLEAFLARDNEIMFFSKGIEERMKWREESNVDNGSEEFGAKLEQYRAEGNFASAISVFQALVSLRNAARIPILCYHGLLRSCAYHNSIDTAIYVWSTFEKQTDYQPDAVMYRYLIQLYGQANEIGGAEDIFKDFRQMSANGRVNWAITSADVITAKETASSGSTQLMVWNYMIEAYFNAGLPDKAIGLVEEMMMMTKSVPAVPSRDGDEPLFAPVAPFDAAKPPAPGSSTYSTVIRGFCNAGDGKTALDWFERLLQLPHRARSPYTPTLHPTRPDSVMWRFILTGLAKLGMVAEANKLLVQFRRESLRRRDDVHLRDVDFITLFNGNIAKVRSTTDREEAKGLLKFTLHHLVPDAFETVSSQRHLIVADEFLDIGEAEEAFKTLWRLSVLTKPLQGITRHEITEKMSPHVAHILDAYLPIAEGIENITRAIVMSHFVGLPCEPQRSLHILHKYGQERAAGVLEHTPVMSHVWPALFEHALEMESVDEATIKAVIPEDYAFPGLLSLVEDVHKQVPLFDFGVLEKRGHVTSRIVFSLLGSHDVAFLKQIADENRFGPSFTPYLRSRLLSETQSPSLATSEDEGSALSETLSTVSTAPTSPLIERSTHSVPRLTIDIQMSKSVDMLISHQVVPVSDPKAGMKEVMAIFEEGLSRGKVPFPFTIGRICQGLGKIGDVAGAKRVYTVAQTLLSSLEDNKRAQSEAWFQIEDSMIITLAQAGDIEGAHVHRQRILDQGGAPSADAYGGLILFVRDTTDDTSNAMALYQESQALGVVPNQYLYNNIISKLAKARKADHALSLFMEMRSRKIVPSSITYGAVIGACARVGDVDAAERLFVEMVRQKNFKPRVPPFNTMMQLYTTTKPNRERALFFYKEMLRAGIKPTAYTYKLLMDAYTLDPFTIEQVEQVFNDVVQNPKIPLQGNHVASLINAYGCVAKDLDAAIRVFDTFPSYPHAPPLDAVIVESMLNVCVAHRRPDLMAEYVARMTSAGVHMTAYIVNVLIKGYATVGDLDRAREMFESTVDAPEGMAALHNHAPHDPVAASNVNPAEPVYREPSTWEVMVRAELGAGHREEAIALLERLKARQYPEAVYRRISGIMVDHSMLPL